MKYYCDGFTMGGNPSKGLGGGGGYTIVDESGSLIKMRVIYREGFTNNEGEILGILDTLRLCKFKDSISTDSMIALTWINSGRSKARSDLIGILLECKNIILYKKINLLWEGREFNLAGIYNETHIKCDYEKGGIKEDKIEKPF